MICWKGRVVRKSKIRFETLHRKILSGEVWRDAIYIDLSFGCSENNQWFNNLVFRSVRCDCLLGGMFHALKTFIQLTFISILHENSTKKYFKGVNNRQSYLTRQRNINKKGMEASSGSRGLWWDARGQTNIEQGQERMDRLVEQRQKWWRQCYTFTGSPCDNQRPQPTEVSGGGTCQSGRQIGLRS